MDTDNLTELINVEQCFISLCEISLNENAPKRGVSGIYRIRNILNGNCYIGSAQCFRARWQLHLGLLRADKNHSPHLQNAWNKYGEDAFVFDVIEIVRGSKSDIIAREQYYLDEMQPTYNASKTAIVSGIAWTDERKSAMRKPKSVETRKRMSESGKRAYELNPELRTTKARKFRQYRELNPDYNRGSNNGMFGVSLDRLKMISPEAEQRRVGIVKQMHRDGKFKHPTKKVEQLSLEGVVLQCWDSMIDAATAIGCAASSISNACRGRTQTCAGFQWRYANE